MTTTYSYDECLAIIDFCIGLERHRRLEPDTDCIRVLGFDTINKILEMNHGERIAMIKDVVQFL